VLYAAKGQLFLTIKADIVSITRLWLYHWHRQSEEMVVMGGLLWC